MEHAADPISPPANNPPRPALTVYYDGACPLCRSEIGLYQGCNGAERVAFVDVARMSGGAAIAGLDRAAALARFHVRRADGTLLSGAAGFAELWRTLPGWRWLGRLVALPGILQATELTYRGFLLIRPAIQRRWRRA